MHARLSQMVQFAIHPFQLPLPFLSVLAAWLLGISPSFVAIHVLAAFVHLSEYCQSSLRSLNHNIPEFRKQENPIALLITITRVCSCTTAGTQDQLPAALERRADIVGSPRGEEDYGLCEYTCKRGCKQKIIRYLPANRRTNQFLS